MTTQRKALELALEALINGKRVRNNEDGTKFQPPLENEAISVISQALKDLDQEEVDYEIWTSTDSCQECWSYEGVSKEEYDNHPGGKRIIKILES